MDDLLSARLEKAREIRGLGVELYPHRWERGHTAAQALALGEGSTLEKKGPVVRVAGRLVQIREMGKASFAHILDGGAKLQVYLKKDVLGEASYALFKKLHIGDFVGIEGPLFRTKTNEITVEAASLTLLAKALRALPEKWHGLQDTDTRYRRRHLDLIANAEVRRTFEERSRIVASVRRTLDSLGFLEVETPILLPQAGGASATPFTTHHNALERDLTLRIATELYLKRLIVGGMGKVYEIGRIFRNEGVDTRHNPEFTMLEAYEAYSDYHGMAALFERVFSEAAAAIGKETVEYRGKALTLKPPFRRLYLPELWRERCGEDIHRVLAGKGFERGALLDLAKRLHVDAGADTPSAKVFERIFDSRILPELHEPAFVLDHPTAITPLAKCVPGDESLVERFEFFIGTDELSNAYTELNDPMDQRERFEEQGRQRAGGDQEADILDEDFVQAMECGMPPTGGIGIGIDRLAMVLTGNPSIREVILFPTLKEE